MNWTNEDMSRLARLAGLEAEGEDFALLGGRLERMLSCMHALDGIEPWDGAEDAEGKNVLRADVCAPGTPREQLLALAPEQDGNYVLVPRTVGEVDG